MADWKPIIKQGITWSPSFEWKIDDVAVDMTGYAISAYIKIERADSDADRVLDINTTDGGVTLDDAASAQWSFNVTSSATKAMDWEEGYLYHRGVDANGSSHDFGDMKISFQHR